MRRRDFLLGSTAALGLAGCGRTAVPRPPSPVNITRAAAYSQDIYGTMRRVLAEYKLNVRGRRVVLKPNLVEFEPESAINTHPMLVHATLEAFRELGHRWRLRRAPAAGARSIWPPPPDISRLRSLYLPHTVLGSDLLVSMPKMKTHHWAGATPSMKNLFGIVPGGVYGWPKNVLHWAGIHQRLRTCTRCFRITSRFVDGIVGMDGNGPIQERPKPAGVIVSGHDPVAVDATCCRIMQIEPSRIEYLTLAGGLEGIAEENIQQIGEKPDFVETRFDLIMELRELRRARA